MARAADDLRKKAAEAKRDDWKGAASLLQVDLHEFRKEWKPALEPLPPEFCGRRRKVAAPGPVREAGGLLAVLNLYEALLIVLALFLVLRRGLARDGRVLLLETVFLVDATFLHAECATTDPWRGAWLGAGPHNSPFRMALAAAGFVYAQGAWLYSRDAFVGAAAGCWLTALAGHSIPAVGANAAEVWRGAIVWGRAMVPKTAHQWGVASIAAAFALLGVGAAVSLSGEKRGEDVPG